MAVVLLGTATACGSAGDNGQEEAPPPVIEEPATDGEPEPEPEYTPEEALYLYYAGLIAQGLGEFRRLMNAAEEFGPLSELIIEYRIVLEDSSQGARYTRFMTPDGRVVRYTIVSMGSRGRADINYHFFENGLVYVQRLRMDYVNSIWDCNRVDIFQYSLSTYVIDGERVIMIDGNRERQVAFESVENIRRTTVEDLNERFESGEPYDPHQWRHYSE